MTNALKKLDDKTKLKFIEAFSNRNTYSTIIILIIATAYYFLVYNFPQMYSTISGLFLIIAIFYFSLNFTFSYRKLMEVGAPKEYMNKFILCSVIFAFGFLFFIGSIFFVNL